MPDTLIVNARLVNEGREFDGDLRIRRRPHRRRSAAA